MSEKLDGWLLKLYPARFRGRYGASAMQLFRDRLRAERGFFRRLRFWFDVVADLAVSVPREYWRQSPAEANSGGHGLPEEAVSAMCRQRIVVPAVVFYVFVALGFITGLLGNSERVLLCVAYLLLAILGMEQFLNIGKFKERWRSNAVILGTDRIQERYFGHDFTILRIEVARIIEGSQGLLIITRVVSRQRTILVPAGMTGYQEVRQRLSEWTPITWRPELWLSDPKPVLGCLLALIPAMLLVRSRPWIFIVSLIYYPMILLVIVMNVTRPLDRSRKPGPRRGLDLAPPAHMWRRFKGQCRNAPTVWWILLVLILLPIATTLLVK
jgi:hypothetical protein